MSSSEVHELALLLPVLLTYNSPQCLVCSLDAMVKAGWDLFDHLEGLSDEQGGGFVAKGISLALASMEAVASQRQRLASSASTYVGNATKFIGQQLTIISNSALPASNELNTTECSAPNHTDLQSELDELMALLQASPDSYVSSSCFLVHSVPWISNFLRVLAVTLESLDPFLLIFYQGLPV